METKEKQHLRFERLATGVPNLDAILGGGIPELSLTIIAGVAGAGKTTLGQQIAFHNAAPERPALFLSTLGEPTLKVLRYQQQFAFFKASEVGRSLHFVSLGPEPTDTRVLLDVIAKHLEQLSPRLLVMDSFRAVEDLLSGQPGGLRRFVHELATLLPAWQCTGLLIGECRDEDVGTGVEFTVADNVLLLSQEVHHNSVMRRIRVVKARGQAPQPGRHAFRITSSGLEVYPSLPQLPEVVWQPKGPRASFGVAGLDEMMHGGVPRGQSCMVAGSSGTGKTLLALHFAVAGALAGEPSVVCTFEESRAEHVEKMAAFGWDLEELEHKRLVHMLYLRPVDLSIDEVMHNLRTAVEATGARRLVLNSISGMESALPQTERSELREGLYRMTANMTAQGLVVLLTTEVPDLMGALRITTEGISFLADNIVVLRYVEIAAKLRRALTVFKMRTSAHDNRLREYRILPGKGIVVERSFQQYSGVLTGIPTLRALLPSQRPFTAGLTEQDKSLMQTLLALKQATPAELAEALGAQVEETQAVLERLAETGYVIRSSRAGEATYRIALITPGARPGRRQP